MSQLEFKFIDFVILEKLQIHQVAFLKEVLHVYANSLLIPASLENIMKYSIAKQLWYELNHRTEKENPPKKSRLKLRSHQAIILLDALNFNGDESRIFNYKNAIIKQLI
ncbi:hypothetical protein [Kordia sp.]|uniref:hypothetical protein n=1 Tax=Kordia sp. TaxID=1965332 RepID=UPI0025C12047|nr:hypothetical protein [Kordia sp.]MCH2197126.1 hypothetical protein [Kordia sp.]